MKILYAAASLALALSASGVALAAPVCPAFGAATDCNILLTVNPDGSLTASAGASPGTYDGSDDVLVGIVNNSSSVVNSVTLSSPGIDIFGFDSDGINTYGAPGNSTDNTGYGGPLSYFSNISSNSSSGVVNFLGGLAANGGTTYFSLEEAITFSQITGTTGATPEPGTWVMLGTGALGLAGSLRRRIFTR